MNNLSNSIYQFFLAHFAELPLDKQLHFASRLATWNSDETCWELLEGLRSQVVGDVDNVALLKAIYGGSLVAIQKGSLNTISLRQAYFEKYPRLRNIAATLYWAALLDRAYRLDLRQDIFKVFPAAELKEMYEALIADKTATSILSTHAVNFLYLYQLYILQTAGPDPAYFLALATKEGMYDLANPEQRQLCIYLLTHTIIGASQFYTRALAVSDTPLYRPIITFLEAVIQENFSDVKLDNKFEFLVCCKLVGVTSHLEASIMNEAVRSVSPNGAYLIDAHNSMGQPEYATFEKSEHRSVLFIMASTQATSL